MLQIFRLPRNIQVNTRMYDYTQKLLNEFIFLLKIYSPLKNFVENFMMMLMTR